MTNKILYLQQRTTTFYRNKRFTFPLPHLVTGSCSANFTTPEFGGLAN